MSLRSVYLCSLFFLSFLLFSLENASCSSSMDFVHRLVFEMSRLGGTKALRSLRDDLLAKRKPETIGLLESAEVRRLIQGQLNDPEFRIQILKLLESMDVQSESRGMPQPALDPILRKVFFDVQVTDLEAPPTNAQARISPKGKVEFVPFARGDIEAKDHQVKTQFSADGKRIYKFYALKGKGSRNKVGYEIIDRLGGKILAQGSIFGNKFQRDLGYVDRENDRFALLLGSLDPKFKQKGVPSWVKVDLETGVATPFEHPFQAATVVNPLPGETELWTVWQDFGSAATRLKRMDLADGKGSEEFVGFFGMVNYSSTELFKSPVLPDLRCFLRGERNANYIWTLNVKTGESMKISLDHQDSLGNKVVFVHPTLPLVVIQNWNRGGTSSFSVVDLTGKMPVASKIANFEFEKKQFNQSFSSVGSTPGTIYLLDQGHRTMATVDLKGYLEEGVRLGFFSGEALSPELE